MLKFFNYKLPTKISCDASLKGLGAVLEQRHNDTWYPVGYASRSLTSAERNYCQLEKEILSVVFACQKFHDFTYGKRFYVFNDHLYHYSLFLKDLFLKHPHIYKSFYFDCNVVISKCIISKENY